MRTELRFSFVVWLDGFSWVLRFKSLYKREDGGHQKVPVYLNETPFGN